MLRLLNCEGAGRVILAGLKRAVSIATVVAFYFTRPLRTYIYRASENFAYINKVVRRVCIFRRAAIPRRPLKAIKTAIDKYFELSIIYKSFESRRATCLFFIYYIATKFFMQAQNSSLSASFLEEKKSKARAYNSTWPSISQFLSLKIHYSSNFIQIRKVHPNILRLRTWEVFRRVGEVWHRNISFCA